MPLGKVMRLRPPAAASSSDQKQFAFCVSAWGLPPEGIAAVKSALPPTAGEIGKRIARAAHAEAELPEDILHIRPAGSARTAAEAAAWAATHALEPLEARLAFRIDLAAVELPALILVAEDFIRLIELGKAFLRLGVLGVAVGVKLLGALAEGLFHGLFIRAFRHAENVIGAALAHGSGCTGQAAGRDPPCD